MPGLGRVYMSVEGCQVCWQLPAVDGTNFSFRIMEWFGLEGTWPTLSQTCRKLDQQLAK